MSVKVDYYITRNYLDHGRIRGFERIGQDMAALIERVEQHAPGPNGVQYVPPIPHRASEHVVVLHIDNPPADLFSADKLGKVSGYTYADRKLSWVGEGKEPNATEFEMKPRTHLCIIHVANEERLSITIPRRRYRDVIKTLDITASDSPLQKQDEILAQEVMDMERRIVFGR